MKIRKCFSLVELILASTMLLIAVIGSTSFYLANRRSLMRAEHRRRATWMAVDAMERIRTGGYASFEDEDYDYNEAAVDDIKTAIQAYHGEGFVLDISLIPGEWYAESDGISYFKVTVTVKRAGDAKGHLSELVTYLAEGQ